MSAWGNSWGFAWGNAWGLLERPYVDLTNAERVYVRELLSAIYVREDVEQIVSVAATQQISVVDAEQVLCVRYGTEPLLVREVVENKALLCERTPVESFSRAERHDSALVVERVQPVVCVERGKPAFVCSTQPSITVHSPLGA